MKKQTVTIRDVAKRAGVAPTTVSRVLNDSGYVSDETRRRVEAVAEELNYVPNRLSQSLRHQRTNTIALVLSDITNPFWTTITRGVEDAGSKRGWNVFLCNTDEKQSKLENYVDVLLQRRVDGFLVVPAGENAHIIEKIQSQSVPLVVLDRTIADVNVDVVRSDSIGGAYRLTEHLIHLGHERIAMITGPVPIATSTHRLQGYEQALSAHNIPRQASLIRHGEYNTEAGINVEITKELMQLPEPPTAIFAGNNFIALGILQALYELGCRIPEDVSVVSFDDVPYNWHPEPFLTVMAQSPYDLGYRAADLLLSFIVGDESPGDRDIVLPVDLIERRSSGPVGG